MSIEHNLTVEKSINEGITLKRLEKSYIGVDGVIKSISFLLLRLQESFNVKNKVNADQAIMISYDILDRFGYETIEDIMIMFKMARQGHFGTTYNKIDNETIFTKWMPEYLELKSQKREKLHNLQKSNYLSKSNRNNGLLLKMWSEIKKHTSKDFENNNKRVKYSQELKQIESLKQSCINQSDESLKYGFEMFKNQLGKDNILTKTIEKEIRKRNE